MDYSTSKIILCTLKRKELTMNLKDFFLQSKSGLIVCYLIIAIIVIYLIGSFFISLFYKKMLIELIGRKKGDDIDFKDKTLSSIYEDFTDSVKLGVEDINTEVIIERNLPVYVAKGEWALNYFVSVATILGLFGTFWGLTGAIKQLKDVLVDIAQFEQFIEGIKPPMANMATAFITSIMGIIGSILMNMFSLIPGVSYKNYREQFYSEVENLLDNEAIASFKQNYSEVLVNFTTKVEDSMKYMTDRVTQTFEAGIDKFAEKINGVSFDLTESAKVLTNVINKLENSVNTFNKPVLSFKESVDSFRLYYEGLDTKIRDIDKIVEKLVYSFDKTIEAFDGNRERLIDVGDKLKESTENLAQEHQKIMELVERLAQYSDRNDEQFKDRIEEVAGIYRSLVSSIDTFRTEVGSMSGEVSRSLKDSLQSEVHQITENINKVVDNNYDLVKEQNESFLEKLDTFGRTINTYGKLLEEVRLMENSDGDSER